MVLALNPMGSAGSDGRTDTDPNRYGDDLANWSNPITKTVAHRRLDDKWSTDNLLGLFDEDLSKRNYYNGFGDYRSHAPAVALWLIYRF